MNTRTQDNIKITRTISRDEFFNLKTEGINFTAYMVNAILDGIKNHTIRSAYSDEETKRHTSYIINRIYYVRESVLYHEKLNHLIYKADLDDLKDESKHYMNIGYKGHASYFVPRRFARIAIQITDSNLKKLHDCIHNERVAEGLLTKEFDGQKSYFDYDKHFYQYNVSVIGEESASFLSFKSLWISIHKINSWYDNPNVWSMYFEPILII